MSRRAGADPFSALGLPATRGLTDDEVRAAWRRVAAATHPDRADGGDPVRFAAAAAAYAAARTGYGRTEALADLAGRQSRGGRRPSGWPGALAGLPARAWRGRPALLALRVVVAAAVAGGAVLVAGAGPASLALTAGAVTWLMLTARHDLAPPS